MRIETLADDAPTLPSFYPVVSDETSFQYFDRRLDEFFKPLLLTPLPTDRLYHSGHVWIKKNSPRTATIGVDQIGAYFLQPIVSVVLPQTPSRMELNSPFTWLVLREGTIALRSIARGFADQTNFDLLDHPYLLLDAPYDSGWILRMTLSADKTFQDGLITAEEFTPLLQDEISTLKNKFTAAFRKAQPQVGATLYDGGQPVKSVQEILGRKKYFELVSKIFSK
ncbi:MAG TPA: hypothetical protein VMM58_11775 [Bacteroidota bacterium]|nr:hypothetical protein [Bacteroidota bacterium]